MRRFSSTSSFRGTQRASFSSLRSSHWDHFKAASSFVSSHHSVFDTKSVRGISFVTPVENEVDRRRDAAALGGGEKRIQAQHAKGKLTSLERIALLLDEGSFVEECLFMESRSEGEKVGVPMLFKHLTIFC